MKFSGNVGFVSQQESSPGVWENVEVERHYRGSVLQSDIRWEQADQNEINEDLALTNRISIVIDDYISLHSSLIRYVEFQGQKWKVTRMEFRHPRVILYLKGLYNG
jgi:hypothetical protein